MASNLGKMNYIPGDNLSSLFYGKDCNGNLYYGGNLKSKWKEQKNIDEIINILLEKFKISKKFKFFHPRKISELNKLLKKKLNEENGIKILSDVIFINFDEFEKSNELIDFKLIVNIFEKPNKKIIIILTYHNFNTDKLKCMLELQKNLKRISLDFENEDLIKSIQPEILEKYSSKNEMSFYNSALTFISNSNIIFEGGKKSEFA